MRMNLYQVDVIHPGRTHTGFVVATDEERAAELVMDRDYALERVSDEFKVTRVDETLPVDRQEGLQALLEHAPASFASFCPPIGWIAHVAPVARLRAFTIEDGEGNLHFAIAPNGDVAAALYCTSSNVADGEYRLFRIRDGFIGHDDRETPELAELLATGSVGLVTRDDDRGWSVV